MCSIFGIGFFRGHKIESEVAVTGIVSRLFREAEVGGRRAAGLSIMREKTAAVLRRPMSGSELSSSDEYLDFMEDNLEFDVDHNKVMSIIGHCRWPTKGPATNNLNNHPIIVKNIIGVHNGVITNDDEIYNSFNLDQKRQAEVDTEVIFSLIQHFSLPIKRTTIDAIKMSTPYLRGSFACGMQNAKKPYNLYLFRNNNPIKILYYTNAGILLFATREHFITNSFEDWLEDVGAGESIDLLANQGVSFNLWNRTMCKFFLPERQEHANAQQ